MDVLWSLGVGLDIGRGQLQGMHSAFSPQISQMLCWKSHSINLRDSTTFGSRKLAVPERHFAEMDLTVP